MVKTDKKTFALCAVAFASYYVVILCAVGYATVFLRDAGASKAGAGVIVAAASIVAAVFQPILGRICDRVRWINWKKVSLALALLLLLSFMAVYFSKNTVLIVFFFAAIVIADCINPFLNESSFYYERIGIHINFGIVRGMGSLSYALVSYLFQFAGLEENTSAIILAGIIASCILLVAVLILPAKYETKDQKVDAAKNTKSILEFVKQYKVFMIFWVALNFIMTFQYLTNANIIDVVQKVGGDVSEMGVALALAAISELPVMFLFSKLLKKLTPEQLLTIGAFFFIIRGILYLFAGSMIVIYIAQLFQMLTYAVVVPAGVYLSNKLIDSENANTGQSLIGFTNTSGAVFGFFIGGLAMEYGGATTLLVTGLVIAVVGFVFALIALCNQRLKK